MDNEFEYKEFSNFDIAIKYASVMSKHYQIDLSGVVSPINGCYRVGVRAIQECDNSFAQIVIKRNNNA